MQWKAIKMCEKYLCAKEHCSALTNSGVMHAHITCLLRCLCHRHLRNCHIQYMCDSKHSVKYILFLWFVVWAKSGAESESMFLVLQKCGICGRCMSCCIADPVCIWWRCYNSWTCLDSHYSSGSNCGWKQVMWLNRRNWLFLTCNFSSVDPLLTGVSFY